MTVDELKRIFPNASDSTIRANLSADGAGKAPVMEHGARPEPLAKGEAEKRDCSRFLVRVVSVRRRLLDEDNLCAKYHVDLCRYAGALPCDAPERCHIETTQRKAAKGEEERTEITVNVIEPPNT